MGGLPWTCNVKSEHHSTRKPPKLYTPRGTEGLPNRL